MADIFNEVEEGLRQDKYQVWLRKYGPVAVGAIALIVGAVAFNEFRGARQAAASGEASEAFSQALASFEDGRPAEARLAFESLAEDSPEGYPALSKMMAAAAALEQGERETAAGLYEEAAELVRDPAIADLARLKAAYAVADTLDRNRLADRFGELAQRGRPFEYAARELFAAASLRDGDLRQAREDYTVLSLAPDSPPGVQRRAQEALALIRTQEADAASSESPPEETAG